VPLWSFPSEEQVGRRAGIVRGGPRSGRPRAGAREDCGRGARLARCARRRWTRLRRDGGWPPTKNGSPTWMSVQSCPWVQGC